MDVRGRRAAGVFALLGFVCMALAAQAEAFAGDASALIAKMEALLWSDTNQGRFSMTIETPYWQRTLELDVWMDRPQYTFIRVLAPKKERGIGSLRKGSEMWNYIPKIDRIVKIPPSMMLQPWMGSDFSNDDLVKQSSLATDYTHEANTGSGNADLVHIVSTPKPDAAVVWGRIESWIHAGSGIPEKQRYFDESGKLIREMTFTDIKTMDGRRIPTRWEMRPVDEEGKRTVVEIKEITFDRKIATDIFTERNLRALDW